MNADRSIPPLRTLPPRRLAALKQHLLTEISREHTPRFSLPTFRPPAPRLAWLAAGTGAAVAVIAVSVALTKSDGIRPHAPTTTPLATPTAKTAFAVLLARAEPASISGATLESLRIIRDSVRLVGSFSSGEMVFARVYAARSAGDGECLLSEVNSGTTPDGRPLRITGGGCSPRLLRPRDAAWQAGAGREADGHRTSYVLGIVSPGAEVQIEDTAGFVHDPERQGNAFLYRTSRGVADAAAVIVRTADGSTHRYSLGR
jgi:hypothetical protein